MAHSLYITYSGGTVNLNSGNIRMMEQYVPRMGDGEKSVDSVELEFSGTAVTDIQTSIQAINKAMNDAITYTRDGIGTRVFAYFQPDGYTTAWRSELVPSSVKEWKLDLDSDALSAARWIDNTPKKVKGLLTWLRSDWWEGEEVAKAAYGYSLITNSNDGGTPTTGLPESQFNCINYVPISVNDISGDLPAPISIKFYFLDEDYPNALHVGNNVYYGGTIVKSQIEAESYSSVASGGTVIADSTASGGTIVSIPLPSGTNTELLRWTGTNNFLNNYLGQMATVFIVFGGTVTADIIENTKYSLAFIDLDASRTYFQTDYQYLENYSTSPVQKLTTMQVPPGYNVTPSNSLPTNYAISLYARQDTSGTITPLIDFIEFLPSETFASYYVSGNPGILTANGYDKKYYIAVSGSGAFPVEKNIGGGIYLVPGYINRLFFKTSVSTTSTDVHASQISEIKWRPRRRLL